MMTKFVNNLWDIYARAVSLITVLTLVIAFVIGGYSFVRLAFPAFTLGSNLHEKYQTNESYTAFGAFHKDTPEEKISRERTENYAKLLRMERRSALQRLVQVGLALCGIVVLNGILVMTSHRKGDRE